MARVPNTPAVATLGQKTMTLTIQCPQCGVVLNVPEAAAGHRLKCPHCAAKFSAPMLNPGDSAIEGSSPTSSLFPTGRGPGSSGSVEHPAKRQGSGGSVDLPVQRGGLDFDLPTSSGPLRDTFELPMLGGDSTAKPVPPARPAAKAATPAVADAMDLFRDEPKSARRPKGAEARAQARRCTSCSNVVPAGMSLCSLCGLDLDTGRRIAPIEIAEEEEMPDAYRPAAPPMGLLFVGSLSAVGFLLLSLASLVTWLKGMDGLQYLLLIWLFGLYASVQFLRRKSIRPLFMSLSLAAGIGAIFLIAMPIYHANMSGEAMPSSSNTVNEPVDPDAPDIRPLTDNLNLRKITWGIAALLGYAAFAVYLNSPGLRRQFHKCK